MVIACTEKFPTQWFYCDTIQLPYMDGESFTPHSHFEPLYNYPNSHYDSIIDNTTEKPSTTEPQLQPSNDSSVIEM